VEAINAFAEPPDLTLFLEVDPEVASKRRAARGGDAELFEDDRVQAKVAREYLRAIRRRARTDRVVRIAGGSTVEQVTEIALAAIRRRLGPRKRPARVG
jgi:thymidylate kinase